MIQAVLCALVGCVWTVAALTAGSTVELWAAAALASAWLIAANIILALVANRKAA